MSNFNGCHGGHCVREFRDATRTWITWSIGFDPPVPSAGSALAAFASLTPCLELAPATMFTRSVASNVARLLRTIRRGEGMTILHDRDFTLPGPATPVGGCRSIRELSRSLGISFRRARSVYLDSLDSEDFSGDAAGITGPAR